MHTFGMLASVALILITLFDCFETMLQPRRVTHRFRYARLYYRATWRIWRAVGALFPAGKMREAFLSVFGPMSLLGLFASWIGALILAFAALHASIKSSLHGIDGSATFGTYVYLSGT